MATTTTRLGLVKPAGTENKQLSVLNSNFDEIDKAVGTQWVNDGALPVKQFHGAVFKELTSGKLFYLKDNGVGGFTTVKTDLYGEFTAVQSTPNSSTYGMGSTVAPLAGNTMVAPEATVGTDYIELTVPGIYSVDVFIFLDKTITARSSIFFQENVNGGGIGIVGVSPFGIGDTGASIHGTVRVASGQYTRIVPAVYLVVSSGPTAVNWRLRIARIGA